jgi:hypothetical protein
MAVTHAMLAITHAILAITHAMFEELSNLATFTKLKRPCNFSFGGEEFETDSSSSFVHVVDKLHNMREVPHIQDIFPCS